MIRMRAGRDLAVLLVMATVAHGPTASGLGSGEPLGRGSLVIVGGGGMPDDVRDKFMALAGGKRAKLVVIPTASQDADRGQSRDEFLRAWRKYDPAGLVLLHTRSRDEADKAGFARPIAEATAVWFSGGDQRRLIDVYHGTKVEAEFRALLARGGVIGGTSAGAAVMSGRMIRGGDPVAEVGEGFGFVGGVVFDQHFLKRNRANRLIGVLTRSPTLVGIGIDEATALVLEGDRWSVLGKSFVVAIEVGKDGKPPRVETHGAGAHGKLPDSGMPIPDPAGNP